MERECGDQRREHHEGGDAEDEEEAREVHVDEKRCAGYEDCKQGEGPLGVEMGRKKTKLR